MTRENEESGYQVMQLAIDSAKDIPSKVTTDLPVNMPKLFSMLCFSRFQQYLTP